MTLAITLLYILLPTISGRAGKLMTFKGMMHTKVKSNSYILNVSVSIGKNYISLLCLN